MTGGSVWTCVIAFLAAVTPQEPIRSQAGQQSPVFRSGVRAVPIHVSVSDAAGAPIQGLVSADFTVLTDGKPAEIVGFGTDVRPIGISLLLADEQHAAPYRRKMLDAGSTLVENLAKGDLLAVASWSKPLAPFTDDRALLKRDLDRVGGEELRPDFSGRASWTGFMGVAMAFKWPEFDRQIEQVNREIMRQAPERELLPPGPEVFVRAIVIASSGMEYPNRSLSREGDLAPEFALTNGMLVFGLGFDGRKNDERLATLAERSGGWFTSIDKLSDVRREALRILNDLHHRYVIGFVPATTDGLDHRLEVRVNRPGARVRVRDSYRPAR